MNEYPPHEGIFYSPDGAPPGAPPDDLGNSEQTSLSDIAFGILKQVVVRDYLPLPGRNSSDGDLDTLNVQQREDETENRTKELASLWNEKFSNEKGLSEEAARQIVQAGLNFWEHVGSAPVDGKNQGARGVVGMLAHFEVNLEKNIKGLDDGFGSKESLALRVTSELMEFVNKKENGKNITGVVSMNAVQASRIEILKKEREAEERARKEAEEKATKEEREKKFDEMVILVGDGKSESDLRALSRNAATEILIAKSTTGTSGEDLIKKVLGEAEYFRIKQSLNIAGLSEYGDANYFCGVIEVAHQAMKESEGSKRLHEWITQTLEGLEKSPKPEQAIRGWIETMMDETEYCYFLGKYSDKMVDILAQFPQDVNLETFRTKIKGLAFKYSVSAKELDMHLDWDTRRLAMDMLQPDQAALPEYSMMRQLGMEQGRGIESYLLLGATQEIQKFASRLSREDRAEWEVRLVAKNIDGGRNAGLAQFYLGALMGDETTGPDIFAFADYIQFLRQAESAKGYADPKDLQKLMEFRGPEVFEMLYRPIHERVEILKEDGSAEWLEFDFRGIDVMAAIDTQEGWAELRVNEGLGVGSYNYAKGKWLKTALYQSMGVGTREEINIWMNQQEKYDSMVEAGNMAGAEEYKKTWVSKPPDLGRIGLTSLSNQQCFEGIGGLAGVNWWAINSAINTGRIFLDDVNYTPLETFERWSMTKVGRGYRSAYSTKYAKFPLSAQPCLDELALLPPMSDYVLQDSLLNPLISRVQEVGVADEINEKRKNILTEIIVVDQPVPDAALRFGEMAVGLGSCSVGDTSHLSDQQIVEFWARKVDTELQKVDVLGSTQLVRPWELWEKVAKRYSEEELDRIWGGLNWKPIAEKIMNGAELTKCQINYWDGTSWVSTENGLEGKAGFKNFLHYANYKLHYLPKLKNTRMDGFWRYRVPAEEDIQAIATLVGAYAPAFHGQKDSKNTLNKAAEPDVIRTGIDEYFKKSLVAGVQKVTSEMKLGTYTDKRMATQLAVSAFKLYCMENMAFNLSETTFSIDTNQSDTPNQSFHASMLTKDSLRERWRIKLGGRYTDDLFNQLVEQLVQRGFYFVETKVNRLKHDSLIRGGGQVLLSPNGSYVPEVDSGSNVLNKLESALNSRVHSVRGEVANNIKKGILDQIQVMKKQMIYSPALLKGGANTTPLILLEKVIDTMSLDNLPSEVESELRNYIAGLSSKVSEFVFTGPYKVSVKTLGDSSRPANASVRLEPKFL